MAEPDDLFDVEIPCLRVMHNDGIGALLRVERVLIGQGDADPLTVEQSKQLGLVFEVGTSGIAEAIARTLVTLREEPLDLLRIFACDPQLFADPLVPQLRKRLGGFDAEPVEVQVVLVVIRRVERCRVLRGNLPIVTS